ncbi:hypothetical protein SAMN05444267_100731 [Chryseobacterium polytrichastri]|uniref:Uncharacterized protein n=1 Tax=Chryseobacterium polytrichastri TaxID=1302687 RepID=A0A1M6USV8_9FLAO|nr:hypothetical protein SAMN05444267_100731 [Chryseobacterium polytrichastri]
MTGLFGDLKYIIFLLTISAIIFPILSLLVINIILDENKKKLITRIFYNLSFIALFLIFQQNLMRCLPRYFVSILVIESLITIILLIFAIIKLIKLWCN